MATVAELGIEYVELPALTAHTVALPVSVNVVPGDQAAGRIPDVTVTSEVLFLEAQETKRRASEALRHGDTLGAASMLRSMSASLGSVVDSLPAPMAAEFTTQMQELSALAEESEYGDALRAAKGNRVRLATPKPQAGPLGLHQHRDGTTTAWFTAPDVLADPLR